MVSHSCDALANISQFVALLTPDEQSLVEHTMKQEHYAKGETIYKEGDELEYIYFLNKGSVKLCRERLDGFYSLQLAPLRSFFDVSTYFSTKVYSAMAETCGDTEVYAIPATTLEYILGHNVAVCHYFLSMMARELECNWQRQVQLKNKQMRARLADTLLYIASLYGYESDGYTLGIQLSRNDLSTLSGMNSSNVSRTLSSLALERLISLEGRYISIVNKVDLQVIAEQE